jgi:hypothetical protein
MISDDSLRIIPVLSPQTVTYISHSSLRSSQSYIHKQSRISHTVHSDHRSIISTVTYISHSSLRSSQSYLHKQLRISHTVHSDHPSLISTNSHVYLTQFTQIIPVLFPQTVTYISHSSLTSSQSYLHKQSHISHTVHSHHPSLISTNSHVHLKFLS